MKINPIFYGIYIIICVFLTFPAFAQESEDVVYLKNGSIIRGQITEIIPNEKLKIQTRDGNLLVFTMDEVEKITKEPFNPQVRRNPPRPNMFSPLGPYRSAYSGLLVGAHTSAGLELPLIGLVGFYDTKIDFQGISQRQDIINSIGVMGTLEWSPSLLWHTEGLDVEGPVFLTSGLVYMGIASKNVTYRFGGGMAFASADVQGFLDKSGFQPTAIAALTIYPPRQNLYSYWEDLAATFYARWQGSGAVIGVSVGLLRDSE